MTIKDYLCKKKEEVMENLDITIEQYQLIRNEIQQMYASGGVPEGFVEDIINKMCMPGQNANQAQSYNPMGSSTHSMNPELMHETSSQQPSQRCQEQNYKNQYQQGNFNRKCFNGQQPAQWNQHSYHRDQFQRDRFNNYGYGSQQRNEQDVTWGRIDSMSPHSNQQMIFQSCMQLANEYKGMAYECWLMSLQCHNNPYGNTPNDSYDFENLINRMHYYNGLAEYYANIAIHLPHNNMTMAITNNTQYGCSTTYIQANNSHYADQFMETENWSRRMELVDRGINITLKGMKSCCDAVNLIRSIWPKR